MLFKNYVLNGVGVGFRDVTLCVEGWVGGGLRDIPLCREVGWVGIEWILHCAYYSIIGRSQ